jgi:hypothetical protein
MRVITKCSDPGQPKKRYFDITGEEWEKGSAHLNNRRIGKVLSFLKPIPIFAMSKDDCA